MATRSVPNYNQNSLVSSLGADGGFSEYLAPDGNWYRVGEGPGGGATDNMPKIVDTGDMTQVPKVAGEVGGEGPHSPAGSFDYYNGGASGFGLFGALPAKRVAAMKAAAALMGNLPGRTAATGGGSAGLAPEASGLAAIQSGIQGLIGDPSKSLADTIKEVGQDRATASPRALLNTTAGSPVNLQALLKQFSRA